MKRASDGSEALYIFRGLYKQKPWIAIFMTFLLMSMAGIPPTSGFMAKYQVFILSISQGYLGISIFAILMAVIGVYYYFFVIREVYTEREQTYPIVVSKINAALIVVCGVAAVLLGVVVWRLPI
jgi:NADH-quinone oxidoreductase subunit N